MYFTRREGNVLFNNALNTFYFRLYGTGHTVKDQSNSERKPTTATTWATLIGGGGEGLNYFRAYIHRQFRHARHETKDRQPGGESIS